MAQDSIRLHCRRLLTSFLLLSTACSGGGEPDAPAPAQDMTVLTCDSNATHALGEGSGVLVNNMWNQAAAGPGPWRQCLQQRMRNGVTEFGWNWSWPELENLYAYPEILIGRSPWKTDPTNDARFPRTIADTPSLWVDYDVETQFTGKRNLAVEFWLTRGQAPGGPPDPLAIRNELMIWTQASDGLIAPSEQPAGVVDIDGHRWTVYVDPNKVDPTGATGVRWQLIIYYLQDQSPTIRYDARKIFDDAITRGLLEPGDTIEGVELGNELVSGSGSTWVKHFQVGVP